MLMPTGPFPNERPIRVDRLPGAKVITRILWAILFLGVAAGVVRYWHWRPPTKVEEKTTLSVLRIEAIKFLVVRRTSTLVVVEYERENWLGQWQGVLWATCHFCYGLDMDKVQPSDVRRDGDVIVVKLPDVELFSFAIKPGSIGYMTKSTAAAKFEDLVAQQQKARDELEVLGEELAKMSRQEQEAQKNKNAPPGPG